jgi:acetylornithine deacetylase/succinyl-diaminopimelate desuccinylase-like protein
MPPIYTPQSLTRRLVSYNTVNPPGNEQECATFIGDLLSAGGFDVGYHEFTPRRTSLVARNSTFCKFKEIGGIARRRTRVRRTSDSAD